MNSYKKNIATSTLALSLAACGGSGGGSVNSDTVSVSAGGIWDGVTTFTDNSQELVVGIVTESGNAVFLSEDGGLTFGSLDTSGSTVSGTFTGYAPDGKVFDSTGTASIAGTVSGSVSERSSLNIAAFYQGSQESSSSFSYDNIYERSSSIAKISDTYSYSEPGYSESITIDSVGDITGSNSEGCVYSGQVNIVDGRYNAYDIAFTIANCGAFDGIFNGLATLVDDIATDDLLIFGAASGPYALAGYFWR